MENLAKLAWNAAKIASEIKCYKCCCKPEYHINDFAWYGKMWKTPRARKSKVGEWRSSKDLVLFLNRSGGRP